ncbi:hypothetical protein CEXT_376081 [Caerostris extrusa]|uniref:Uncharacterized protein n=1 Tax=Caerostris extrusa TaxID=172846 RepID=A0AAV4UCB8_CAEEX|nr:hypothetical protein CEXT_376081 [Caerostris extrusa]
MYCLNICNINSSIYCFPIYFKKEVEIYFNKLIDLERSTGKCFQNIKKTPFYNVRFFDEPVTRPSVSKESITELDVNLIGSI